MIIFKFNQSHTIGGLRLMVIGVILFLTMNAAEAQTSQDSLFTVPGNQGGIGIAFDVDSVYAIITQVFPNSPAERSGQLNVGDRIIGIGQNDHGEIIDVRGKPTQEFVGTISGPVGTKVRIAILSADKNASDPPIIVELVREQIQRRVNLSNIDTWYFEPGDNLTWADPDYDHSDWIKMSQVDVREPFPDSVWSTGYGWFRTYFKVDSAFYFNPWYLELYTLGAAEVYIDGKLVNRYGVFSTDPSLEKRYNPEKKAFIPIWLSPQDTHLVAVRFSYHGMHRDKKIMGKRSQIFGFWLAFHSQKGFEVRNQEINNSNQFNIVIISILTVLVILFWLIVLFNRSQVHMVYLATTTTLFLMPTLLLYLKGATEFTSYVNFFLELIFFPSAVAWFFSIIFLTANILQVTVHRLIKVYVAVVLLIAFGIFFLPDNQKYVGLAALIGGSAVNLYYLVRYRKKISGPKAIIVYGLLLTFGVGIFVSLIPSLEDQFVPFAIPISLLVYMAFWLKDMIKNIQDKAEEVVRVSNEKKALVENQNILLEEQVTTRTAELNQSLENLKATQSQLIQAEKMAGLGELTAGIAHEIQNPLNFVNNFSEVNKELLQELTQEIEKGNFDEVKFIAQDVIANQEKINHHGKRAEGIVKGMLQHSRTSSGQKELTDIHALCDEYLRLAYHGLRAKDKSFNAKFETDFDSTIEKINVVPQDIGRVVLNLINNAFYACAERSRSAVHQQQITNNQQLEPLVTVSTKNLGSKIEIRVKDNGPGIPEHIKEKIFQPFYTTKPTGQGTGLGLSLSYDIVKAHGGELMVETKENKGSEFVIQLPV